MKSLAVQLFLFSVFKIVFAQSSCSSVTNAVVGSICGTLGFVALVVLVYYLITRNSKKNKHEKRLNGYDNPLTIDEKGTEKSNGLTSQPARISNENVYVEETTVADWKANETNDEDYSNDAHTCLLGNKTHPTNGFSVIPQDGDIVIADVMTDGPAYGKLHEGDSIVSVTVFFDDISYEHALTLLSTAAPYKVAVSVTKKIPKRTLLHVEQETPTVEYEDIKATPSAYEEPIVPKMVEQTQESSPPPVAMENPIYAVPHANRGNTLKRNNPPDAPHAVISRSSSSSSSSLSSSASCSQDDVTEIKTSSPAEDEELHGKHHSSAPSSDKGDKEETSNEDGSISGVENVEMQDEPQRSRSSSTSSSSSSGSDSEKDKSIEPDTSDQEHFYVAEQQPEPPAYENVAQKSSTYENDVPIFETPTKKREDIVFTSGWRKLVKLLDLAKAGLVNESTMKKLEFGKISESDVAKDLKPFLCGQDPIAGLLINDTGERMSFFDASKQGIIRRGTGVSLLEAQAATGSIINPKNGDKMTVNEAKEVGLLDKQIAAVLIRAEKAVNGFDTRLSDEPLSLFEAMKRKLIVENHGIRLLEAQIATGGIIDPKANHRLPIEVAYERGLFDEKLRQILDDPGDDTKGFFDPNTGENLTYLELLERCVLDQETNLKLLPFNKSPRKGKTL